MASDRDIVVAWNSIGDHRMIEDNRTGEKFISVRDLRLVMMTSALKSEHVVAKQVFQLIGDTLTQFEN